MTILAPAKINLFLDVLKKREDGYHDLSSIMQTIGLFDTVRITVTGGSGTVSVTCDENIPCGNENTAYAAAESFLEFSNRNDVDVNIDIEKKIPSCAGLGGGSSDAAVVIIALNKLLKTSFDTATLCEIGASVGSDVPYCVKRGTCIVSGRGEIVQSCTPMPDCAIVVAMPTSEKMSTAEAYAKIDEADASGNVDNLLSALAECSIEKMGGAMFNKFEHILPDGSDVFALKKTLASFGSPAVLMSGSGTAVYGLFENVSRAKDAAQAISEYAEAFICRPCRRDDDLVLDEGDIT